MSAKPRGTQNSIVRDADQTTVKRAQWEAFEFDLEAPGLVRVTNGSYSDPENHSYIVNVETDSPVACECKAFEYNDGPCKHMVAVVIRQAVLKAAQAVPLADGGEVVDACQNGQEGCCGPQGDDLPCFECFQSQER